MLVKFCEGRKNSWDAHLDTCTYGYNTSRHDSTKFTPFQLMFGRKAVLPVELEMQLYLTFLFSVLDSIDKDILLLQAEFNVDEEEEAQLLLSISGQASRKMRCQLRKSNIVQ